MKPTVQDSLDFVNLKDALETAATAMRAGADWIEAGTPLVMAEGEHAIRELRVRYPDVPILAGVKMMDGGRMETRLMAEAGANMVVVMDQAHSETIEMAIKAGRDFGAKIMGDNMAPLAAKSADDLDPVFKMICERVHAFGDVKTRKEASA